MCFSSNWENGFLYPLRICFFLLPHYSTGSTYWYQSQNSWPFFLFLFFSFLFGFENIQAPSKLVTCVPFLLGSSPDKLPRCHHKPTTFWTLNRSATAARPLVTFGRLQLCLFCQLLALEAEIWWGWINTSFEITPTPPNWICCLDLLGASPDAKKHPPVVGTVSDKPVAYTW